MKPDFSPGNPYWQPAFGWCSKSDFLYAASWEMRKPSPTWTSNEGGGVLAERIQFHRGAAWKAIWVNQVRHWLGWNKRRLGKEQREREAGVLEAAALGMRI